MNILVAHPHGIEIRPVRRARRAFRDVAAGQIGLVGGGLRHLGRLHIPLRMG